MHDLIMSIGPYILWFTTGAATFGFEARKGSNFIQCLLLGIFFPPIASMVFILLGATGKMLLLPLSKLAWITWLMKI